MLTLIALSAALLQDPPAPPPPPLEVRSHFVFMGAGTDGPGNLDADGDGQVTREEFAAPLNDAFGKMDKDGDGRLSTEELASDQRPGDGEIRIHRLDDSANAARMRRFERDGEATMVFVGPGGADTESRMVVRTLPRGGPARVHFGHGPNIERDGRVVVRTVDGPGHGPDDLDKDGDGKVSEAEFVAPLREAFTRMDADHSGYIEDGEHGDDNQVHVFTRRIETRDE